MLRKVGHTVVAVSTDSSIAVDDLRTIPGLIAENPDVLTEPMLRWQLRHRFENGLAQFCVPVGRKLLISKSGYERWLASQAGTRRGEWNEAA